jgi:hypothetical protein
MMTAVVSLVTDVTLLCWGAETETITQKFLSGGPAALEWGHFLRHASIHMCTTL